MAPPFTLTPQVLELCSKIERVLGRCEGLGGAAPSPQLRRKNQIRTVHATTAIEGSTLSLEQITAVLDGKRVRGPAREIVEVRNALDAYTLASTLPPRSERAFLRLHGVLMRGLAEDAGRYRSGDVGIFRGRAITLLAPPAARVATLMKDLFRFAAKKDRTPPLVRACVVHYELEFIHPFSDGNGRMGRLWQHMWLCEHSPVFSYVPVESLLKADQKRYYRALSTADKAGDSTSFVVFMLERLLAALEQFMTEFHPRRSDVEQRLSLATEHFARRSFSRSEYLELLRVHHRSVSAPTASRDLRQGIERGLLKGSGAKATARYVVNR